MENREAYLVRSKEQAFKHLDDGNADKAYEFIIKAMKNHTGLCGHAAIEVGTIMRENDMLKKVRDVKMFIDGIK